MARNEANTKQQLINPRLQQDGWLEHDWQVDMEYSITAGRIHFNGKTGKRERALYADYLLRYKPAVAIAVVEAKSEDKHHLEGEKQARDYAAKLGLWFAYSTNGIQIEFFDLKAGTQETVERFHTPEELWVRYLGHRGLCTKNPRLMALTQDFHDESQIGQRRKPRYYQERAVRATVEAVLEDQKRIMITQATGTGKTFTAIQLVYKLFKAKVAKRVLFIVDRNLLADQAYNDFNNAMDKDACYRLSPSDKTFPQGRSVYFGIYQTLVGEPEEDAQGNSTENAQPRPDRYKEFPPDFFDLIVIDEAHRGGANRAGNWFRLLKYFESATQVGLTATPRRDESVDTYDYFGSPVINYSLKDGIEDGFLSPYIIKRVTSNIDALGHKPEHTNVRDVQGRIVPPENYMTPDFERKLSIPERTRAFAFHLLRHLFATDPLGKTIVFCVDQNHALDMAKFVNEAFALYKEKYGFDYDKQYGTRITGNDKDPNGKYPMLEKFSDLESIEPIVVTTSKLLTTGVDVKTVKNVVLFRNIGSMVEFKQIIGRGTRIYDHVDKAREKLGFFILEYANFSTQLFEDPEWDDTPSEVIDDGSIDVPDEAQDGQQPPPKAGSAPVANEEDESKVDAQGVLIGPGQEEQENIKYRMSNEYLRGQVKMVAESMAFTGPDGKPLSPENFVLFQSEAFKKQFSEWAQFQKLWRDRAQRKNFLEDVAPQNGLNIEALTQIFFDKHKQREVDTLDIVAHLVFGAEYITKSERIARATQLNPQVFKSRPATEQALCDDLLASYVEAEFQPFAVSRELWQTPRLRKHGSVTEIMNKLGGQEKLQALLDDMQQALYDERIAA
jgi:type I restriction enzyme R subunit